MLRNRQDGGGASTFTPGRDTPSILVGKRNEPARNNALSVFRLLAELGLVILVMMMFVRSKEYQTRLTETLDNNAKLVKRVDETSLALAESETTRRNSEERQQHGQSDNEDWEHKFKMIDVEQQESKRKIGELESKAGQRNKALDRVQKYLSDSMQDECLKEYPTGPAHILIDTSQGEIEIEMAPCEVMPVVTMHFLRQVKDGFWDGMSFFRAESHVIQASDVRPDGARPSRTSTTGRIKRSQSIPFQEYSDQYVHKKFTLGIAGRPGGPDFYVNMEDNTRIHGPGGQGHNYQGDPDSDSCFAKIMRGEDVAERIQKLPYKKQGGLHILLEPVEIKSMKIL